MHRPVRHPPVRQAAPAPAPAPVPTRAGVVSSSASAGLTGLRRRRAATTGVGDSRACGNLVALRGMREPPGGWPSSRRSPCTARPPRPTSMRVRGGARRAVHARGVAGVQPQPSRGDPRGDGEAKGEIQGSVPRSTQGRRFLRAPPSYVSFVFDLDAKRADYQQALLLASVTVAPASRCRPCQGYSRRPEHYWQRQCRQHQQWKRQEHQQ